MGVIPAKDVCFFNGWLPSDRAPAESEVQCARCQMGRLHTKVHRREHPQTFQVTYLSINLFIYMYISIFLGFFTLCYIYKYISIYVYLSIYLSISGPWLAKNHHRAGLNHLAYLLSISVSMAVIKDFSTNHMKALGPNQAYMCC